MGKFYYDSLNAKVCESITERQFVNDSTPFFLAERGECTFVKKVRFMENIGVAVAIIYDNREENVDDIIMSDDGTGGGLRIPSMLISKNAG